MSGDRRIQSRVLAEGIALDSLAVHSRLPLVAGLGRDRPSVQVWEFGPDDLRELTSFDRDASAYAEDDFGDDRRQREPRVAWHPSEPRLLLASTAGLSEWSAGDGLRAIPAQPSRARYRDVAYGPDGIWAAPSVIDGQEAWRTSDVIEPATGSIRRRRRWDTAVVRHPSGRLVAFLASDQGATHCLFARVDGGSVRLLDRALVLDCDGYEAPIFSPDGRFLVVRGGAYGNSVQVFELPGLQRVLALGLGEPTPPYPYPQEWLDEMRRWSRQNVLPVGPDGELLLGTPDGALIRLDLEGGRASEHVLPELRDLAALAATPDGRVLVATRGGQLVVVDGLIDRTGNEAASATRVAEEFLESAGELPDDADVERDCVQTDGVRTWTGDDLDSVIDADDTDPTWLQLTAFMNAARE